jgi:hypothetical protein
MEYRAKARAPQCGFCGGVLKLEEQVDPVEQTEKYVEFAVDRTAATEAYRRWISQQGFFRPSNLSSAARLESMQSLWWVGWVLHADTFVTWTADSDAEKQKADWAPHAGELQAGFDNIVIPATRGLSSEECGRLIPTYSLSNAVTQPTQTNAEFVVERFEVSRSFARARLVEAIQQMAESVVQRGHIPGSRFRNLHASIQLRGLVARRMAFPAYVLAYRYRGQLYRTVISGQDSSCVIGEAPRSLAKLALVIALGLAALGAVVAGLILSN